MKAPITTSRFSLFKAGPGPSISHTMGPMHAGFLFRNACASLSASSLLRAASFRARLFGSLSAIGAGHGTDAALLAGLLGWHDAAFKTGTTSFIGGLRFIALRLPACACA